MKKLLYILTSLLILSSSCKNKQELTNDDKKLRDEQILSDLISSLDAPTQKFVIDSKKPAKVIGEHGTIIYFNPVAIETIDGTPIGDSIRVELIELTTNLDLVLSGVQTTSNEKLLVSGGAYNIEMYSGSKQLRIKDNQHIDVAFPRLCEDEMSLFLGARDSLHNVNWQEVDQKFVSKNIPLPTKPERNSNEWGDTPPDYKYEIIAVLEDQYDSVASGYDPDLDTTHLKSELIEQMGSQDLAKSSIKYDEKLAEYEAKVKELKARIKTYEAIPLNSFGWINCDRFYNTDEPLVYAQLLFNKDTIHSARFFAVFRDINSLVMKKYYSNGQDVIFKNLPCEQQIIFVGVTVKDSISYWFEKDFIMKESLDIQVDFQKIDIQDLKNKFKELY